MRDRRERLTGLPNDAHKQGSRVVRKNRVPTLRLAQCGIKDELRNV